MHLKLKNWNSLDVKISNRWTFSVGSGVGGYEKCLFIFIKLGSLSVDHQGTSSLQRNARMSVALCLERFFKYFCLGR